MNYLLAHYKKAFFEDNCGNNTAKNPADRNQRRKKFLK